MTGSNAKLLNVGPHHHLPNMGVFLSQIAEPVIKVCKFAQALVPDLSLSSEFNRRYSVDWRALERNKYAPWGRGHASGLSGKVAIPKGNR